MDPWFFQPCSGIVQTRFAACERSLPLHPWSWYADDILLEVLLLLKKCSFCWGSGKSRYEVMYFKESIQYYQRHPRQFKSCIHSFFFHWSCFLSLVNLCCFFVIDPSKTVRLRGPSKIVTRWVSRSLVFPSGTATSSVTCSSNSKYIKQLCWSPFTDSKKSGFLTLKYFHSIRKLNWHFPPA